MNASERSHLNEFSIVFSQAFKWAEECKLKHKQYVKCLHDTKQGLASSLKNSEKNHPQLQYGGEGKVSDPFEDPKNELLRKIHTGAYI